MDQPPLWPDEEHWHEKMKRDAFALAFPSQSLELELEDDDEIDVFMYYSAQYDCPTCGGWDQCLEIRITHKGFRFTPRNNGLMINRIPFVKSRVYQGQEAVEFFHALMGRATRR